jgi:two-component system LytT family sensor kinase
MMKHATKIEKVLPFILAFLLPGINFFNNSTIFETLPLFEFLSTWFISSGIMLIIWFTNAWLINQNYKAYYLKALLFNIAISSILILMISLISPVDSRTTDNLNWMTGFRILFASAIFITIQLSFKSFKKIEKLKLENLSLKAEMYKAELDQFKKQINPHFLFNSLNILRSMIRNANPNSEAYILKLSSLYRQILQTHSRDHVSLEEELKFLEAYTYLMKVRHENALTIDIEINPISHQYSVPIFALQLLVENCIKHNIVSNSKPLLINIFQKDELTITVSNNLQPKQSLIDSEGVGLSNLLERYKLMGIEKGLEIEKTVSHYNVTIKLL